MGGISTSGWIVTRRGNLECRGPVGEIDLLKAKIGIGIELIEARLLQVGILY